MHNRNRRVAARFVVAFALFASLRLAAAAQELQERGQAAPPPVETQNAAGQTESNASLALGAGAVFAVEATSNHPLKAGEPVEARLLHPVYSGGKLALAEGTLLRGTITALSPDKSTRARARLHGDFTPFHNATVQFNSLLLPTGALPIKTTEATHGAPMLMLVAPGAHKKSSFIGRQVAQAKKNFHTRVEFFTAPGFGSRALQIIYHQLPFHPERIPAGAAWSFELTEPVVLPAPLADTHLPIAPVVVTTGASKPAGGTENWKVRAVLTAELNSKTAKPGDAVEALVVEPVFDRNMELVIPQGSVLVGKVSSSKAARSLGRSGSLRFNFQQIRFPDGLGHDGKNRDIQGQLAGALTGKEQGLQLDAEGTVTQPKKSSIINPLLLTLLAGRALDTDGNLVAQTGVASNGFGFVGRIVGVAAGSRNLAAGIGFYAAALSLYENWLTPGHDIVFPRDMRIEIETSPLTSPVLKRDESN